MKYITPVPPRNAHGLVRDVYRQIKNDFGAVVDPFAVHSISPRLMAAVWAACRESEVVGAVPRERKEAIAVAISQRNQTPFCVDAHVVMLHALAQHGVAQAILDGSPERLPDPTRSIVDWATTTCATRGSDPPPVTSAEAAELIGTVVFFHYMNRIAIVLLDETPLPSSQRWLKPFLSRVAGWYFSFAARRPKTPGDSLLFLPAAPLPPDLSWAAASESVGGAWARFAQEVERQGEASLPPATRLFAAQQIREWPGDPEVFDRTSIEETIDRLPPDERPAARLVLLTALAPHEVDDDTIRAFADPALEQERLLGALSWASFTAARRIGALLHSATDKANRGMAAV
jgi:AhpD family alkylhydroperoxidase